MIWSDFTKYAEINYTIKPSLHQRTWEFYCLQYVSAFLCFLHNTNRHQYKLSCISMPFLFLMRHSIELLIKYHLDKKGIFNNSHNLISLISSSDINYDEFEEQFDILRCESDGACFRYVFDNEGNRFFCNETIDSYETCQNYIHFYNTYKPNGCPSVSELSSNIKINEFNFRTIDCRSIESVANQYDESICVLLDCILSKEVSIQDVYLPLLFLVRHTLELKLKSDLYNLGNVLTTKEISSLDHSITKLWRIFRTHIGEDIEKIPDDHEIKKESMDRFNEADDYQLLFSQLDNKSMILRYPMIKNNVPNNLKPTKDILSDILPLYANTDTFLKYVNEVLIDSGFLTIGDDKIMELMGYDMMY